MFFGTGLPAELLAFPPPPPPPAILSPTFALARGQGGGGGGKGVSWPHPPLYPGSEVEAKLHHLSCVGVSLAERSEMRKTIAILGHQTKQERHIQKGQLTTSGHAHARPALMKDNTRINTT